MAGVGAWSREAAGQFLAARCSLYVVCDDGNDARLPPAWVRVRERRRSCTVCLSAMMKDQEEYLLAQWVIVY